MKAKQPRSGTTTFKKIAEILERGTLKIPIGKFKGSGGLGNFLLNLLNIKANNSDSPDLADWEIKFHSGASLLTLFHKNPEPRGIIGKIVNEHGWNDSKGRISFRHTIKSKTSKGFYIVNKNNKIIIRNRNKNT